LPETLQRDAQQDAGQISIFVTIKKLLSCSPYVGCMLVSGLLNAVITAFNTGAPFLFKYLLHVGYHQIGLLLAIPSMSMVVGLIITILFVLSIPRRHIIFLGTLFSGIAMVFMLMFSLHGVFNVYVLMVPITIISFCIGLIVPYYWTEALLPFADIAATAAAFFIFVQNIIAMIAGLLISALHEQSQLPIASVALTMTSLGLLSCYFLYRRQPS